jgi:hypothetical protein
VIQRRGREAGREVASQVDETTAFRLATTCDDRTSYAARRLVPGDGQASASGYLVGPRENRLLLNVASKSGVAMPQAASDMLARQGLNDIPLPNLREKA